jgi:hypothetical protein
MRDVFAAKAAPTGHIHMAALSVYLKKIASVLSSQMLRLFPPCKYYLTEATIFTIVNQHVQLFEISAVLMTGSACITR